GHTNQLEACAVAFHCYPIILFLFETHRCIRKQARNFKQLLSLNTNSAWCCDLIGIHIATNSHVQISSSDTNRAFTNGLDENVGENRNGIFLLDDSLHESEFFLQVLFAYDK